MNQVELTIEQLMATDIAVENRIRELEDAVSSREGAIKEDTTFDRAVTEVLMENAQRMIQTLKSSHDALEEALKRTT